MKILIALSDAKPLTSNSTNHEKKAVTSLSKDPYITIPLVDKGRFLIILYVGCRICSMTTMPWLTLDLDKNTYVTLKQVPPVDTRKKLQIGTIATEGEGHQSSLINKSIPCFLEGPFHVCKGPLSSTQLHIILLNTYKPS